jgi:hypothetical protein
MPLMRGENTLGWDLRQAMMIAGVGLLALSAPSLLNLAYSPFRHMRTDEARYVPFFPNMQEDQSLMVPRVRAKRFDVKQAADGPGAAFAKWADPEMRAKPTVLDGETLPQCNLELGFVGHFTAMSDRLAADGYGAGARIFTADIIAPLWLYGETERLEGGAPWYYGGLTGFEQADYLLVPLCPIFAKVRGIVLDEVAEMGSPLREVNRNALYILYRKG